MSIASEITRLQGVKSDILQAISDKGVTVPAGSALDDCPALIAGIPTGGGTYDINDYFEFRPVYWNNTSNSFSGIGIDSVSNEDLEIIGKFYTPSGKYLRGRLFSIGVSYNLDIGVQYQNSSQFLLNNGSGYTYTSHEVNLTGVIDVYIYKENFKVNNVNYTGNYSQISRGWIYPIPGRTNGPTAEPSYSSLIELILKNKTSGKIYNHFVGARRKRDSKPCILDLANCTSYYNSNNFLSNYNNP
jgi:hypothetical protein